MLSRGRSDALGERRCLHLLGAILILDVEGKSYSLYDLISSNKMCGWQIKIVVLCRLLRTNVCGQHREVLLAQAPPCSVTPSTNPFLGVLQLLGWATCIFHNCLSFWSFFPTFLCCYFFLLSPPPPQYLIPFLLPLASKRLLPNSPGLPHSMGPQVSQGLRTSSLTRD